MTFLCRLLPELRRARSDKAAPRPALTSGESLKRGGVSLSLSLLQLKVSPHRQEDATNVLLRPTPSVPPARGLIIFLSRAAAKGDFLSCTSRANQVVSLAGGERMRALVFSVRN